MNVERNDSLRVRCIETVLRLDDETLLIVDSVLARFAGPQDSKRAERKPAAGPAKPDSDSKPRVDNDAKTTAKPPVT